MSERTIPIAAESTEPLLRPIPTTGPICRLENGIADRRGRFLHDLRISVTDHCNFRCRYCMPKEKFDRHYRWLTQTEMLSFEEITRLARAFLSCGVRKLRLTGGEPLLRKRLPELVAQLKELRTLDGTAPEIAMTTNGALLARMAQSLRQAGLDRVTVSLDALDEKIFQTINDVGFPAARVLQGIDVARDAGLPVKVNTVIKRGWNEDEAVKLAGHFRGTDITVRFIEFMDAGTANGWNMRDVVPSRELVETIGKVWPLESVDNARPGETARRWRYVDGQGELGFISSVTEPFCRDCNRARVSIEGALYLCLFADHGWDLRRMLRGGATAEEIAQAIARIWTQRDDHYSEIRGTAAAQRPERIEMQYIGG